MISTIHSMQHHVQSTYGDSKTFQGRKVWGVPIAGIGLGNRARPQIWAAVSTPLFQILADDRFLALVICSISRHCHTIAGFGFIDDTDLCVTAADHNSATVLRCMQQSLQTWAALLRATGSTLVPEKCFWYMIQSTWNNKASKWEYKDPDASH